MNSGCNFFSIRQRCRAPPIPNCCTLCTHCSLSAPHGIPQMPDPPGGGALFRAMLRTLGERLYSFVYSLLFIYLEYQYSPPRLHPYRTQAHASGV